MPRPFTYTPDRGALRRELTQPPELTVTPGEVLPHRRSEPYTYDVYCGARLIGHVQRAASNRGINRRTPWIVYSYTVFLHASPPAHQDGTPRQRISPFPVERPLWAQGRPDTLARNRTREGALTRLAAAYWTEPGGRAITGSAAS